MAGFTQRLRMNGLFPGDIRPPDMGGFDPNEMLKQIIPRLDAQDLQERNDKYNVLPKPNLARIGSNMAAPEKKPMNVVFNPGMTPYQSGSLDVRRKDIESRENLGRERLEATKEYQDRGRDIQEQRADIYDFKSKNPGMKLSITKGGNFVAFNPLTGETIDTGHTTGTMSDEEKLRVTGENQVTAIGKRNEGAMNLQGKRNEGSLAAIAARVAGQKDVNAAKPEHGELPTQTRVRQSNTARQLANDPELGKFIEFNSDGTFNITPPGKSYFGSPTGPSVEQFKKINDSIFNYVPPAKPAVTTKPTASAPVTQPTSGANLMEKTQRNSKGETRTLVSSDGGKTWSVKK